MESDAHISIAESGDVPGEDTMVAHGEQTGTSIQGAYHAAPKTIYLWQIPADNGYALRLEIEDAPDAAHARTKALQAEVPLGEGEWRRLTQVETQWVASTEPVIVRDTATVTLAHDGALAETVRLDGLLADWRRVESVFAEYGIDVTRPNLFIDETMLAAKVEIAAADLARSNQHKALSARLQGIMSDFAEALDATGYAPLPPATVPEPDCSLLTVVAPPTISRHDYPRLAGATWTSKEPGEPLSDLEAEGRELLLREGGIIDERARGFVSDRESAALRAIETRISTEIGR